MKKWCPIAVEDVPALFDDEYIRAAWLLAKFKVIPDDDFIRLADGVRKGVAFAAEEARRTPYSEVYWKVDALGRAANAAIDATVRIAKRRNTRPTKEPSAQRPLERLYDRVAVLLEALPVEARGYLEGRGPLPVCLPSRDMLRDPCQRVNACDVISSACFDSMRAQDRRSARSRTWHYRLCIRPPSDRRRGSPIRDAVLTLVMCLQGACCNAGIQPSWTADPRKPGPFARFAKRLVERFGVPGASAIEAINELDCMRKGKPRRLSTDQRKFLNIIKAGPKTQTEISKLVRRMPKDRVVSSLMDLKKLGRIVSVNEASGGRPRTIWRLAVRPNGATPSPAPALTAIQEAAADSVA